MSHEIENDSKNRLQEQCRVEIEEMRVLCQSILAKTHQQPEPRNLPRFARLFFEGPKRSFDSQHDPTMALLTRAASRSQVVPYVTIYESSWAEHITLLGKNPASGKAVRVMEIQIPIDASDLFATSIIMCQDIFIPRIPYYVFAQSGRASLVSDVVIPSLRAIDRHLSAGLEENTYD